MQKLERGEYNVIDPASRSIYARGGSVSITYKLGLMVTRNTMTKIISPERVSLKGHPDIKEKWIEDRIIEDPTILGLGDVIVKDRQRTQPHAGRLDLLLQDPESTQRYEVEIQVGQTDESHIIRTIEYWDLERKRYPQYEHTAVIIAEEITSRFFNVISLFNASIPIIAIQMNAFKADGNVAITFNTILDVQHLGLTGEDEETSEITDRNYWLHKGSEQTIKLADDVLKKIQQFSQNFELKYNKFYIGLADAGVPNNFVIFRPRKKYLRIEIRLPVSKEIDRKIELAGLDEISYDKTWGRYRFHFTKEEFIKNEKLIMPLLEQAYKLTK